MTKKHIELLLPLLGLDPQPPVLRAPWEQQGGLFGQERAGLMSFRDRQDFGWALAERVAGSSSNSPLLKRPEFRWVRAAAHLLRGGVMASRHLRDTGVVAQAHALHSSATCPVLNATLMTNEASVQSVAEAFKIDSSDVVEAYTDLFFNVLDRKGDLVFLQGILRSGNASSLFLSNSSLPTEEESLLAVGFRGTIEDVFRAAGWSEDEDDVCEDELSRQVTRKVLQSGVRYLSSPNALKQGPPAIVSHAIDISKKSKVEPSVPHNVEVGDFASSARDVLSGDALRLRKAVQSGTNEPSLKP